MSVSRTNPIFSVAQPHTHIILIRIIGFHCNLCSHPCFNHPTLDLSNSYLIYLLYLHYLTMIFGYIYKSLESHMNSQKLYVTNIWLICVFRKCLLEHLQYSWLNLFCFFAHMSFRDIAFENYFFFSTNVSCIFLRQEIFISEQRTNCKYHWGKNKKNLFSVVKLLYKR